MSDKHLSREVKDMMSLVSVTLSESGTDSYSAEFFLKLWGEKTFREVIGVFLKVWTNSPNHLSRIKRLLVYAANQFEGKFGVDVKIDEHLVELLSILFGKEHQDTYRELISQHGSLVFWEYLYISFDNSSVDRVDTLKQVLESFQYLTPEEKLKKRTDAFKRCITSLYAIIDSDRFHS